MLDKLRRLVESKGFFSSALKVGSGQLISQALSLISVPILSRVYSESAYGDRAILISTAAIIINLSTMGLNSAIMKPAEDNEAKKVLTTAVLTNFIISTVVVLICASLENVFHLFDITGSYLLSMVLLWLYMVLYMTQMLIAIYTNRRGKYNKLFVNPIIGAVANFVLSIPLGLLGWGYEGFIISTIIVQIILIIHMSWKDIPFYLNYRIKDFIYVLRTYKDYIFFQYPSNFINNLATEYPTQFLGGNFTSNELGYYSMCLNILKYPIRLVATPISNVYFKTASEYYREGKNLADFTFVLIRRILIFSIIPVSLCCFFSEKIFAFALGNNWASAGTIASIKAIEFVMLFCVDCVSYCRVCLGKQKSNLIFSIIKLLSIVVFAYVGFTISRSLMGTIIAITICNTILNIIDMAVNFYYLEKKYMLKYCMLTGLYVIIISVIVISKYTIFNRAL